MNAQAQTAPLAATSADLAKRIDDERRRLLMEQNLQVNLEGQRLAPLEAGDDEALDRVEAQINGCCDRQARIQERLEILQRRLDEARANERQSILDELRARAESAREIGEGLIRKEYAKSARQMAAALAKLDAIDAFIESANRVFDRAGENAFVESPNHIRQQPRRQTEKKVRRVVNIFHPAHPHYGKAVIPSNRQHGLPAMLSLHGGGECDNEVEIEEIVIEDDGPYWNRSLTDDVVLPTIEPTGQPLWRGERRHYGDSAADERRAVMAELGIDTSLPEV